MPYEDFPNQYALKLRAHILYVHLQSTIAFAEEIATDGPHHLEEEKAVFDELAEQLERAYREAVIVRKRARGEG